MKQIDRRALVIFALCCLTNVADAQAQPGRAIRQGWYVGIPVTMEVQLPKAHAGNAPDTATPAHPDVVVYLTAPTMAAAAPASEMTVPTPQGDRVLPAHDDVVTRMVTERALADAIGYFVVPGPKADESTVRAQPDPGNSVPGAPLAREIFVGTDWVKLNSHVIIEYGLAMGWLELRPFAYGGLMSTRYSSDAAKFGAEVTIEPPVHLPSGQ